MKIQTKRIGITIFSGTLESLLYIMYLTTNNLSQSLTPFWIVVIFCIFYLGMFVILYALGLKKSKKYLQTTTKWDSPKIFGITLVLWWIFCFVLYFIKLDNGALFLAVGFTIADISGLYMRNIYRKQRNT